MTSFQSIAVLLVVVVGLSQAQRAILLNGYRGGQTYLPHGQSASYRLEFQHLGFGMMVNVNKSAFYIGGMTSTHTLSNRVYVHIDGSHDTTTGPRMQFGLIGMAAAANGSVVYKCGGAPTNNGQAVAMCAKADSGAKSWQSMAMYPERVAYASMVILNGAPYVFGGARNDGPEDVTLTDKVYMYEENTESWIAMADMPIAAAYMGAVRFNPSQGRDQALLCGGWVTPSGSRQATTACHVYDTRDNSWKKFASLKEPRVYTARLFCIGGWGKADYDGITTVEQYDETTQSWQTLAGKIEFADPTATAIGYGR